jgi:hypothetical protein
VVHLTRSYTVSKKQAEKLDERKFLSRWVGIPNYSTQHAPIRFRPDPSI